jgi:agmatinase
VKGYGPADATEFPRFSGIRTFMRLPQLRDLSGVDFVVVGAPFDTGATFRVGARFGPEAIRSASMLLRPYNPEWELPIFDVLSGADYGDFSVVAGYLPESHEKITDQLLSILDGDVTPIVLGGDHSITLPELRAVAQRFGPVALIQFDAHGDVWPDEFESHATPFWRAAQEGLLDLERSSQVGLRGSAYDAGDLQRSLDLGFQVFTAGEVRRQGLEAVAQAVKERAGSGPVFLTFDMDFADPAYAPAVGTPEVGGFASWECQYLVRGLRGVNFVAFDLVEVSPPYDHPGAITALLAANIAYEFISLLAVARC